MRQSHSGLQFGTKRYHDVSGRGGGGTNDPMVALQANMMARNACVRNGLDMWQQIFTQTYTSGIAGAQIQVPFRNVGLVKKFWVVITAIVQANGQTQTLAPLGASQILSTVVMSDLSNQTRINTSGWHLHGVASAKRGRVFGAAYTSDTPSGYGDNFASVMAAPATINTNPTTSNVFFTYEIPCSYTDQDLRGAIYANVTNATAYLNLTINPNFFVTSTADPTFAVYKSSSATLGLLNSLTVTVYQNYLDQLPLAQNGPVLPLLDLSTAYLFNTSPLSGLVNNQDVPIPYANFRDFMSTFIILDNNGTLNTGSDVNYWALQSANYTNIFKLDPQTATLMARQIFMDDPPPGTYYFNHRNKPISTIQYGNMQMVLNGLNLNAAATLTTGYEMLALINMITQAGSIYGT